MTEDVLFSITSAHLDTGLRGFQVGTCRTSRVDPQEGVSYVGYPIAELADRDPEEIIWLLLHRELPTPEQLAGLQKDLAANAELPPSVLENLARLPRDGHPMEWLATGLLLVSMTTPTRGWVEDALTLIARTSALCAAIYRLRSGWGDPIAPAPDLGIVENFVHMAGLPGADVDRLTRVLRSFYILHMDHGGGNLSTFTGKAVASGHANVTASMAAAMIALSGPLHGGANQSCLQQLQSIGTNDEAKIEAFVRDTLQAGGKIYGFGHGVLRAEDPRAKYLYSLGAELFPEDELVQRAGILRRVAVKVLKEKPKISNPYPNVDAASGSLLHACGLTDASYYTVLFGFARIAGIAAQIVDERTRFRGGKGVPIYRPKFVARDQDPRHIGD